MGLILLQLRPPCVYLTLCIF